MSHYHDALLRMFQARRLHPWLPEHAVFIQAEIAKLEVIDPSAAETFREFYGQKLKEYEAEQAPTVTPEPTVIKPVEETPVVPEVAEEKVDPPTAKKPGRKPKISPL